MAASADSVFRSRGVGGPTHECMGDPGEKERRYYISCHFMNVVIMFMW